MAVNKNPKTNTWEVRCYYKDWSGERKQKTKRGFKKKSDALDWERTFKLQQEHDLDMPFKEFIEIYRGDMETRLKANTWNNRRTKSSRFYGVGTTDELNNEHGRGVCAAGSCV